LVVGTDAASLEPCIAEDLVEQGYKLAEMGGSFDGRAGEAEVFRHFVVVDRQMAVVFLVTQHLPWFAKFSNQHRRLCHRFAPLSNGDLFREKLAEEGFNVLSVGFFAVRWRLVATCGEMFVVQRGESDDLRAQKRDL
jgi:hypothetical protein